MKNNLIKHNFSFSTAGEMHGRHTRYNDQLYVSNPFTRQATSGGLLVDAMTEFNNLDGETRSTTSLVDFKRRLKTRLITNDDSFELISPYLYLN